EDAIRAFHVTGVQTCALPLSDPVRRHGPLLPSQGEKLSALAGTTLWERAMPVKCNHSSVQALFVGMGPLLPSQGEKLSSLAGTKIGRASCRGRGGSAMTQRSV